jgi:hypothetical protein
MGTLPTVPTFVALDSSLTKLQQLSACVEWIIDCSTGSRPIWHLYRSTTLSLSANTWTNYGGAGQAIDTDGVNVLGTGVVEIQTQGYYVVEGCGQLVNNANDVQFLTSFLWTAGANNPHFSSGATQRFGTRGGATCSEATTDAAQTPQCICPNVCYPLDTIQFQVWTSTAFNLDRNSNNAYQQGRFVTQFTGMWLREGT